MCAVAVAFVDFGCSLSFDTGPLPSDDGGPQGDTGAPDHGGTPGYDSGDGNSDTGADTSAPKPQPPKFIDKSTDSAESVTVLRGHKPPGALQGDLLLASIYVKDAQNGITPPAGWTLMDQRGLTDCGTTAWAYHFCGNAEPSEYDFAIKLERDFLRIAIVTYRGVDRVSPIGQHVVTDFVDTLFYGPVSLTTDQPNETLVMMVGNKSATGWLTPDGMNLRVNADALGVFDEPRPNAGKTDSRTATSSGSASDSCGDVQLVGLHAAPL